MRQNGDIKLTPFIKIKPKYTDKFEVYKVNNTRFDLLSAKYYNGNANYDWLILLANPHLPSLEFLIEEGTTIRIPYPLDVSIEQYIDGINVYDKLYGL
ncbi:MAG: tail protein X [Novosphingobium sp.]|nr:tail protein X [Novosphingobium sp.]